MKEVSKFVGLDTHKDTIAVAGSDAGGWAVRYYGEIPNTPKAIAKLVKDIDPQNGSCCDETPPMLRQACMVFYGSFLRSYEEPGWRDID